MSIFPTSGQLCLIDNPLQVAAYMGAFNFDERYSSNAGDELNIAFIYLKSAQVYEWIFKMFMVLPRSEFVQLTTVMFAITTNQNFTNIVGTIGLILIICFVIKQNRTRKCIHF